MSAVSADGQRRLYLPHRLQFNWLNAKNREYCLSLIEKVFDRITMAHDVHQ